MNCFRYRRLRINIKTLQIVKNHCLLENDLSKKFQTKIKIIQIYIRKSFTLFLVIKQKVSRNTKVEHEPIFEEFRTPFFYKYVFEIVNFIKEKIGASPHLNDDRLFGKTVFVRSKNV